MNMKFIKVGCLLLATVASTVSYSAQLKVVWDSPEKYSDIYPGTENKITYQNELLTSLEKIFQKLADNLPAEQILIMKVVDVDLAGTITFANSHKVRMIDQSNPPKITFVYQLIDNNKVVKSDIVILKAKHFKFNRSLSASRPLQHEKRMMKSWFNQTFDYS